MKVLAHSLHKRLKTDLRFRYQCGFKITRVIPSVSTLSRVFSSIKEQKLAEQLFYDLVEECYDGGIIAGDNIAIESTAMLTNKRDLNPNKTALMLLGELNSIALKTN